MTPPIDTKGAVEAAPVAWRIPMSDGSGCYGKTSAEALEAVQIIGSMYDCDDPECPSIAGDPVALYSAADYAALSERLASAERERDEARQEVREVEQQRDLHAEAYREDFRRMADRALSAEQALDALRQSANAVNEQRLSAERELSKARSELAEVRKDVERLDLALAQARQAATRGAQDTTGHHCEARKRCISIRDSLAALSAMREEK